MRAFRLETARLADRECDDWMIIVHKKDVRTLSFAGRIQNDLELAINRQSSSNKYATDIAPIRKNSQ